MALCAKTNGIPQILITKNLSIIIRELKIIPTFGIYPLVIRKKFFIYHVNSIKSSMS
jgi:hypothetical protein